VLIIVSAALLIGLKHLLVQARFDDARRVQWLGACKLI
jgi:hypothetical protein